MSIKMRRKSRLGKAIEKTAFPERLFQHLIYILQEDIFLQREREPDRYPEGFCEILSD